MSSTVSRIPAAPANRAIDHFSSRLTFETDCWDVNHAIQNNKQDFTLLDVRAEEFFHEGHVPTAVNLPHWKITESTLGDFAPNTLFVVYCAGPHCNGATKAAIALAKLGRPVKEMIGGVVGWTDEGFKLVSNKLESSNKK